MTPKQELLEHKYPGDLPADVAALRTAGHSWRDVAWLTSARSGLTVSHESMRSWYGRSTA